jgi:exodeoxyribonuclease VIII
MLTIPFSEYAAIRAVNWTKLKRLWTGSALHYWDYVNSDRDDDSIGRMLGRLTHKLVLEPDSPPDYVVWEGGDRRGKAWKEFEAANAGKDIFKPKELEAVHAQAAAVLRHPIAKSYLQGSSFEQTLKWTDKETGLPCKCRMDANKPGILIDLKGCKDVSPFLFSREAERMGYALQLAHYGNGLAAVTGSHPAKYIIIAVEHSAPYDVGVFTFTRDQIAEAQEDLSYLLRTIQTCMKTGIWPGKCPTEQQICTADIDTDIEESE